MLIVSAQVCTLLLLIKACPFIDPKATDTQILHAGQIDVSTESVPVQTPTVAASTKLPGWAWIEWVFGCNTSITTTITVDNASTAEGSQLGPVNSPSLFTPGGGGDYLPAGILVTKRAL